MSGADQSLLQQVVRKYGPERVLAMLDADQRAALPFMWPIVSRPKQRAPVGRRWRWWLIQAGRGFGKTRSGSEWVREKAKRMPGSFGAIIGQTPDEARAIQVEGIAGILAMSPANERPEWTPSTGVLRWPGPDGASATVYSGHEPAKFRGPQFHWAWVDEFAKFKRARDTFDNLNFGLRLEYRGGDPRDLDPQCCITTTPRPIAVMRDLVKKKNCVITHGTTYDNRANLADAFFEELKEYEGTRIGEQELKGRLLDDTPGALWTRAMFDAPGFHQPLWSTRAGLFDQVCVAIDPAVSDTDASAETGIICMGMWWEPNRSRLHTLADRSMHGSPGERCRVAIKTLMEFEGDHFVVETNNGGDWIPAALQNEWENMKREEEWAAKLAGRAPVKVVTASRGKHTRAEPISTLYEQVGRVTHEPGLEELEDQLVTRSPLLGEKSPDRLDALVWAATHLSTMKRVVLT